MYVFMYDICMYISILLVYAFIRSKVFIYVRTFIYMIYVRTYVHRYNMYLASCIFVHYLGRAPVTKSHLVPHSTSTFLELCNVYSCSDWWRARSFAKVID